VTREILNLDAIVGELEPHPVQIFDKLYDANPDPDPRTLLKIVKLSSVDDVSVDEAWAAVEDVLHDIFGDAAEEILDVCGAVRINALLSMLFEAYTAEGKAPGSSRASRRAGDRSKPTSKGSTASTSAKRASARNGSDAAVSHA
jgi:hypothetical protein